MGIRPHLVTSLPLTLVVAVNCSITALGFILILLPITVRRCLYTMDSKYFPIYPEGRPTAGSIQAPYFPSHLSTSDNSAQIFLGIAAAIYGCLATSILYLQWTRPLDFTKPFQRIAGWVAMIIAGGSTAILALFATGLAFENQEGSGIDLKSVGYWPWQNMFPTINWSIERWTCKVHEQLDLPMDTTAALDFRQMCEYSRTSKWLALSLIFLGLSAVGIGFSALAEQRCLEKYEISDLKADTCRGEEKNGKRFV